MAPRHRFQYRETSSNVRNRTLPLYKGVPRGYEPSACWPGSSPALLARNPPGREPTHNPRQGCRPPPRERETGMDTKSALSVVETDGLPAAVPLIRRVRELPQVVPSALQCSHLSEAAFLSLHSPPFTSQQSKSRRSQALPWRPAWL